MNAITLVVLALLTTDTPVPTSQPANVDDKLVKKLLGGESTTVDQVEAVLTGMDQASKKLEDDRDAGSQTQKIQRSVLDNLDQLIEQARKNRSQSGQKSSVSRKQKKTPAPRPQPKQDRPKSAQTGANRSAPPDQKDSKPPTSQKDGKDRTELARGWGYLPGRDREEVMQGFDEEFLTRYREQIMQYYRDLAKAGEDSSRAPSPATPDK